MNVTAIKCPDCKDTVFSRAQHDFRWCSCKSVAVDGGFEYLKISFTKELPERFEITVDATKKDLYDDWSSEKNKYGIIKSK